MHSLFARSPSILRFFGTTGRPYPAIAPLVDSAVYSRLLWHEDRASQPEALHIPNSMSAAKKLIPLLDRVLVEKIAAPTKSVGGVLLPESAVQKVRPPLGGGQEAQT